MKALKMAGLVVLVGGGVCGVLSLAGVAPLGLASLGLMVLGSSLVR